jgi:hypothetical protein
MEAPLLLLIVGLVFLPLLWRNIRLRRQVTKLTERCDELEKSTKTYESRYLAGKRLLDNKAFEISRLTNDADVMMQENEAILRGILERAEQAVKQKDLSIISDMVQRLRMWVSGGRSGEKVTAVNIRGLLLLCCAEARLQTPAHLNLGDLPAIQSDPADVQRIFRHLFQFFQGTPGTLVIEGEFLREVGLVSFVFADEDARGGELRVMRVIPLFQSEEEANLLAAKRLAQTLGGEVNLRRTDDGRRQVAFLLPRFKNESQAAVDEAA